MKSFWTGFEKQATSHAMELAGLGILARPAVQHLAGGPELSEHSKDIHEAVGLGVLAAPSVHAAAKATPKAYKSITQGVAKAAPGVGSKLQGAWKGLQKFRAASKLVHA